MDISEFRKDIISRLKRIEGQMRGIQKMVGDEQDCQDVLIQLAAANAAMQAVAAQVLKNYTRICLADKDPETIGDDLAHAVAIWLGRGG